MSFRDSCQFRVQFHAQNLSFQSFFFVKLFFVLLTSFRCLCWLKTCFNLTFDRICVRSFFSFPNRVLLIVFWSFRYPLHFRFSLPFWSLARALSLSFSPASFSLLLTFRLFDALRFVPFCFPSRHYIINPLNSDPKCGFKFWV